MITRDKVYFSLAMVTCIIQATGLLVTLAGSVVDEGRGFYVILDQYLHSSSTAWIYSSNLISFFRTIL
jgi:hypothetical protein